MLAFVGCTATVSLSSAACAATAEVPQARGAAVFSTYCVLCHGPLGKGDGRAAALQKVPPADLSKSRRSIEYKVQIIRDGGAVLNRSSGMPAWRDVLTAEQIAEVAAYLGTLGNAPASSARNSSTTAVAPAQGREQS